MKVDTFSHGKTPPKNEDFFDYNQTSFVIADGATDKSGRLYQGKTGGEIVSRLTVKEALETNLNGIELISHLNKEVAEKYKELDILSDITDPKFRFTCGLIAVRLLKDKIAITSVGDLGFRVNGDFVYSGEKAVDDLAIEARSKYIQETGDVEGSRAQIMPLLLKQFEYQNNTEEELGYGVIDGTHTPDKFIQIFEFDREEVKSIELFTDGYFQIPEKVGIHSWEEAHKKVEQIDPDKWKKYKSTKSKDDRTVALLTLE